MRPLRLPLLFALLAVLLLGASRADASITITNTDHDLSYGRLVFKDLSAGTNSFAWSSWHLEPAGAVSPFFHRPIAVFGSGTDRCDTGLQEERSSGRAFRIGEFIVTDNPLLSTMQSVPLNNRTVPSGRNLTICWYVVNEGSPSRLILSSLIDYRGVYAPTIKSTDPDPAFGRLHLGFPVFDRTRVDWSGMQFVPAAGVSLPLHNKLQAIEHFGSGACAADPAAALKLPSATSRFEHNVSAALWTPGDFTAPIEIPPLRSEEATLCWYLHESGRTKLVMRSDLKF
jgi:hypothetical protein